MDIKVGTSGYSFEDWKGTFYPTDIKKGKMFDYYLKYFPAVEINSTYYRIPHPAVMANIDKKAPQNYHFMVKTPNTVTHKRNGAEEAIRKFSECLKPMGETGKLRGLLAQFPYSFKCSDINMNYIKYCRELLHQHEFFVEFRHNSWLNRKMYDEFKANNIGYVAVDEPGLPGLLNPDLFNTTDTAYVRLHGRNTEQWWQGGPLRYDYDYSREELEEWRQKIDKMSDKVGRMYIFFNNCHLGQAVKNAREMMQMLNL
jgi:uncharacterized protein YecE (DUF72 family)